MPTIVTIRLHHPVNEPKLHKPSAEFLEVRARYKESGKIAAQDYVIHPESKTEIKTTVFKDRAAYNEWISEPIVQAYFDDRNEFLKNNFIWKEINVEDV